MLEIPTGNTCAKRSANNSRETVMEKGHETVIQYRKGRELEKSDETDHQHWTISLPE